MQEGVVVVGDIHGDSARLGAMLPEIVRFGRRIVFVGDYINRGADSFGVLELLTQAQSTFGDQLFFLCGNHEVEFLNYIERGQFGRFAGVGGIPTLLSYLPDVHGDVHAELTRRLPAHHLTFLHSLRPFWEEPGILISHTGYDPADPNDRGEDAMVMKSHPVIFHCPSPYPLVVCGHYVQRSGKPYVSEHLICVDTGCGTLNGPLTALILPERRFLTI